MNPNYVIQPQQAFFANEDKPKADKLGRLTAVSRQLATTDGRESKLLKGGYVGDYTGSRLGVIKGDTRRWANWGLVGINGI